MHNFRHLSVDLTGALVVLGVGVLGAWLLHLAELASRRHARQRTRAALSAHERRDGRT